MDWLNALAGLLVGLIVGVTGVGGGSLMSPILILIFGVAPATAIGTDLWFAGITKSFGGVTHHRQSHVDVPIVAWLCLGSIPAAIVTLWVLHNTQVHEVREGLLIQALGVVLVLTAIATLFRRIIVNRARRLMPHGQEQNNALKRPMTVVAGAVLGVLVTMTSVGAGAIGATLLLILYPLRLTAKRLIGTDIAHAVPLTLVAGTGYLIKGDVDLWLLASLLIGSIPGIIIGSRLTAYLPEKIVQRGLALVLMIVGIKLLF